MGTPLIAEIESNGSRVPNLMRLTYIRQLELYFNNSITCMTQTMTQNQDMGPPHSPNKKTLAPPSFHENLTLQNMIVSSHTPKYMIPH